MGKVTNAYLVYGIRLEYEVMPEMFVMQKKGFVYERAPWDNPNIYDDGFYSWYKEATGKENTIIDCITHCSNEFPMYILSPMGFCKRAIRGYPNSIDLSALNVPFANRSVLQDFIGKYNLRSTGDFGWWLCSYWG